MIFFLPAQFWCVCYLESSYFFEKEEQILFKWSVIPLMSFNNCFLSVRLMSEIRLLFSDMFSLKMRLHFVWAHQMVTCHWREKKKKIPLQSRPSLFLCFYILALSDCVLCQYFPLTWLIFQDFFFWFSRCSKLFTWSGIRQIFKLM